MRGQEVATGIWNLDQIPFSSIDRSRIEAREDLFYMVTAASFVEIAADLYTDNLMHYFADDDEVAGWLQHHWKVEEMRHGRSLRDYVRHVWPEFDWDKAYAGFFADYSQQCSVDAFEPTRGLEMVARCVVETGTSTLYQTLAELSCEPVLTGIATRIRAEEINHYKHFYRYFRKYSAIERPGRLRIASALKRRLVEARQDDAECALRHAFVVRNPGAGQGNVQFEALFSQIGRQVRSRYPVTMASRMLIKPLALPAGVARVVEGPLANWVGWVLRH